MAEPNGKNGAGAPPDILNDAGIQAYLDTFDMKIEGKENVILKGRFVLSKESRAELVQAVRDKVYDLALTRKHQVRMAYHGQSSPESAAFFNVRETGDADEKTGVPLVACAKAGYDL